MMFKDRLKQFQWRTYGRGTGVQEKHLPLGERERIGDEIGNNRPYQQQLKNNCKYPDDERKSGTCQYRCQQQIPSIQSYFLFHLMN